MASVRFAMALSIGRLALDTEYDVTKRNIKPTLLLLNVSAVDNLVLVKNLKECALTHCVFFKNDGERNCIMAKFSLEKARIRSKIFNETLRQKVMSNPEAKALYERRKREIELEITLRKAREIAHELGSNLSFKLTPLQTHHMQ